MLVELSATKLSSAERNLALHLSRLIGLSDSVTLARGLRQLPDKVGEAKLGSIDAVQEDVLASRERMMQLITRSFSPESELTPFQVPSSVAGMRTDVLLSYQPYQRFYTTHQVEMASGIQSLRLRVRDSLVGVSLEMHKLVELDRIVDESLSAHTRKLFNVTPKLLEQRFEELRAIYFAEMAQADTAEQLNEAAQLSQEARGDEKFNRKESSESKEDESNSWRLPGGWLNLFYRDMRELLLAEFDVRLQPVLGLLEALNEQTTNPTS